MNAEFSFIEYTYNPLQCPEVPEQLRKVGFALRAENEKTTSVWKQNQSVIFLRKDENFVSSGVTGVGFNVQTDIVDQFETTRDPELSFPVAYDPAGTRILLVNDAEKINLLQLGFSKKDLTTQPTVNLQYISGITYNYFSEDTLEFYTKLGFRVTKTGEQYSQLTAANNRFTIVSNRNNQNKQIQSVIFETLDIFDTTAKCVANDIKFKDFVLPDTLDYGSLTHKIYNYNCLPYGNKKSYTIENFIPDALPNTDFILRMRRQFIDITEHLLLNYYERIN